MMHCKQVREQNDGNGSTCHYVEGIVPASHIEEESEGKSSSSSLGQTQTGPSECHSGNPVQAFATESKSSEKIQADSIALSCFMSCTMLLFLGTHMRLTMNVNLIFPILMIQFAKGSHGEMGRREIYQENVMPFLHMQ